METEIALSMGQKWVLRRLNYFIEKRRWLYEKEEFLRSRLKFLPIGFCERVQCRKIATEILQTQDEIDKYSNMALELRLIALITKQNNGCF